MGSIWSVSVVFVRIMVVLVTGLMWFGTSHAQSERRVALVVGNADYVRAPLVNPVNDAVDLAAALRRLGFEVLERRNRNADDLRRDLAEFQDRLGPGAVGLFYFAGHGMQAGRGGKNYLLPVGMDYRRERDVELFGLDASTVLARMEESGARLSLVILDACRDSPLPPEGRTTASRGLGRMEAPSGSLVAFATAPGSTADENRGGRNGLYTQYLLQAIEAPGLKLEDMFKQVRRDVERASNRKQSPEEISKLTSDFYFRPAQQPAVGAPATVGATGAAASPASGLLVTSTAPDPEVELWELAKRRDSILTYEAYLQAYPQGRYVAAARAALAGLSPPVAAVPPVTVPAVTSQSVPAIPISPRPVLEARVAPPPPAPVRDGDFLKDCAECPEMVAIPAGRFLMGSPGRRFLSAGEEGRSEDEGPQRWVDVPRFAMGKFEVTQRQWEAVMGSNPSHFRACGPDCPVEQVSWNDAQEFVRRLSQRTGQNYRLPSEAEWEYAARSGTTTAYFWGDAFDAGRANNGDQTVRVGSYGANAFGLHDMHGNVYEWVQDVWQDNYAGAPSDGSAWMAGVDQSRRVLRGGSWCSSPQVLRSANRSWGTPDLRRICTGFRIARTF